MTPKNIWNFELKRGSGRDPKEGASFMDVVSWFAYSTLGDRPECSCPVIAAYCRPMSDAMTDAGRQKLKTFIPRFIDNRDLLAEKPRMEYLVWQAIRVFAPFWLDKAGMHDKAVKLRNFFGTFAEAKALLNSAANVNASATAAVNAAIASVDFANLAVNVNAIYAPEAAAAVGYTATILRISTGIVYIPPPAVYAAEWEPLMIAALNGVLSIGKQAKPIEPARIVAANKAFQKACEDASHGA